MEEMRSEVEETGTVEQRPSTKYGRTAYQQQMQEEQGNQQESYGQEQQPQENAYRQYQNPYQNYTPYEEKKPEVKNAFAYILMVLVGLSLIFNFVANVFLAEAYSMGNTLDEVVDAIFVISAQPTMVVLTTIIDVVSVATLVLLVLDVIQLQKAGKKIVGAILFAIFLRPAYFIWRAHLLGQKKASAIVYAVIFYMVSISQYVVLLMGAMEMVMRVMY